MVDNQSAIRLIENPEFHERAKHIETRYHYVRELYHKGKIKLKYVPTEEQVADFLTKALSTKKTSKIETISWYDGRLKY